jgi:dipeptidyl aminopeptidase/acylaminoacyl peptidase
VWTRAGEFVRNIVEQPLRENVPIGGVETGPRAIAWMPSHPHALRWTVAQDDGDPRKKVAVRDHVYVSREPGTEPLLWFATEHRAMGVSVAQDGRLAMSGEFDRESRRVRMWRVDALDFAQKPVLLFERSMQDQYGDPGTPIDEVMPDGRVAMRQRNGLLFRSGKGASQNGERPFLDSWDPLTGVTARLWQCAEGRYEQFAGYLDDDHILIRSESPQEPPQYVKVTLSNGEKQGFLHWQDPALLVSKRITKELIRYQRKDGVALSATLYLPPDHQPGQKHPTLVWAYPQEFTRADDAGQVRASPTRYTRFAGISHLWLLLAGYAVLDDAAMPIVGPNRGANDTYVQQLTDDAQAAVDLLVSRGIADPAEIAVGGHSYGAFMSANLLCHTDLFATAIARSGAYNRTLTPFGFQNEERTFWEAQQVYMQMSPFAHADKVNEPILLIHGADDDNQGTWPIQSQRFYAAIKGHGGTARLCMLPHEAHGYRGRQSVLHCVWEMVDWLDRHVKGRAERLREKPAAPANASGTKQG